MGTSVEISADTVPPTTTAQSLFAKLKATYTPKKRNFSEYYIDPLEPYRQYSPGDAVKGSVVVNVVRPFRITHLTICLHGFVKVFQNAKIPGESISHEGRRPDTNRGAGKRGSEYFGNGFASLFENEVTICGEGRLDIGKYVFHFDLELPSNGLPTSIDFERGTIAYLLTSTLTRPTALSPASRCDRKISLVETIDIAPLPQPKPRIVSIETVTKKSKTRLGAKLAIPTTQNIKGVSLLVPQQRGHIESNGHALSQNANELPRSPAFSEHSSAGGVSSGTSSCLTESPPLSRGASVAYRRNSIASDTSRIVTAMTELACAGCLPGDIVPLKISVDHTKPIKAMQGIIITLYRQGRVDTSPTIPLGPAIEGQKQEYEYYPKSLTGLGGLSLSSAGSSRLFRQDLNQTLTPLIIDPRSLTAIVRTSIQVPENVFPTVSSTPGAMISFKYYLEVVIDLRGKPVNQDRFRPRLGMVNAAPSHGQGDPTINGVDGITGSATSGFCSLDTRQMRREKGVVSTVFEIIVGTRDSSRQFLKSKEKIKCSFDGRLGIQGNSDGENGAIVLSETSGSGQLSEDNPQDSVLDMSSSRSAMIPPPLVDYLDEKTRLKQAEERLLPSAPPENNESASSANSNNQPSAPSASTTYNRSLALNHSQQSAPQYDGALVPRFTTTAPFASITNLAYRDVDLDSSAADPQDDKQELERQRLQIAASSPGDAPDIAASEQDVRQTSIEPTAPILSDDHSNQYYGPIGLRTALAAVEPSMSIENLPTYKK